MRNDERHITPAKEARITAALMERVSQRAIARRLKVSRDTIRATRKKSTPDRRGPAARRADIRRLTGN